MTSRLHPVEFDWKSDAVADTLLQPDTFDACDLTFKADSPEVVEVEAEFFEVPGIEADDFESLTLELLLDELYRDSNIKFIFVNRF